jgi:hypothetical protein
MLPGAPATTEGPFSCFTSGRVHPNPKFQQSYAFTPIGERANQAIYRSNVTLMQEADCAIVNLTPFRGPSGSFGMSFGILTGFAELR